MLVLLGLLSFSQDLLFLSLILYATVFFLLYKLFICLFLTNSLIRLLHSPIFFSWLKLSQYVLLYYGKCNLSVIISTMWTPLKYFMLEGHMESSVLLWGSIEQNTRIDQITT